MAADALKSASITNLDLIPPTANTAGEGALGYAQQISDWVLPTTGGLGNTSSVYKFLRLQSTVHLKTLDLFAATELDSGSGLVVDVGAYYSDSTVDGTPEADQGTVISANCFLAAVAFGQGAGETINAMAKLTPDLWNVPLWQAAGLTADPGGMIDIAVAVHTAAGTAVAAKMGLRAIVVA